MVLESLGLKKRLSSVYMRQEPVAAGKILKVKELVAVQNVRKATPEEAHSIQQNWTARMSKGLRYDALMSSADGADPTEQSSAAPAKRYRGSERSPADELWQVWIDEHGFVVDAGRLERQAPRGYRIVGNVLEGTGEQVGL